MKDNIKKDEQPCTIGGVGGFDKVKFVNDVNAACEQFRRACQAYINSPEHKRMIESFKQLGAFRD